MNKHNISLLKFKFSLTLGRIGNHHPVPRKEREVLGRPFRAEIKTVHTNRAGSSTSSVFFVYEIYLY